MSASEEFHICLLGTGNPLRTDDGAGIYCCEVISKMDIPGLTIMTTQQLQPELVPQLLAFDKVLVVDASVLHKEPAIYPFVPSSTPAQSSSHHVSIDLLYGLAHELYRKNISFYCCAIPAKNLELGDKLSAAGKKQADKAVQLILKWIESLKP